VALAAEQVGAEDAAIVGKGGHASSSRPYYGSLGGRHQRRRLAGDQNLKPRRTLRNAAEGAEKGEITAVQGVFWIA
jgi:hypothetical protein